MAQIHGSLGSIDSSGTGFCRSTKYHELTVQVILKKKQLYALQSFILYMTRHREIIQIWLRIYQIKMSEIILHILLLISNLLFYSRLEM